MNDQKSIQRDGVRRGWGSEVWRDALMRSAVGVVARFFFLPFLLSAKRNGKSYNNLSEVHRGTIM